MIYEKNSRLRYLEFFKGMQLIQESLYRIKVNREDQFFYAYQHKLEVFLFQ